MKLFMFGIRRNGGTMSFSINEDAVREMNDIDEDVEVTVSDAEQVLQLTLDGIEHADWSCQLADFSLLPDWDSAFAHYQDK